MRRQRIIFAIVWLIFGMSLGYLLSLGSSFKKSSESVVALSSAVTKMNDFSDTDIAVMLRMFKLSQENKPSHTDKLVIAYLANYYIQRSALSSAEQEALGVTSLLSKISKLQESSEELKKAIESKKINKSDIPQPLE